MKIAFFSAPIIWALVKETETWFFRICDITQNLLLKIRMTKKICYTISAMTPFLGGSELFFHNTILKRMHLEFFNKMGEYLYL